MEELPQNNNSETIEDEKALLSAIVLGNQLVLEGKGILAKARAMLPDSSPLVINERTRVFVTLVGSASAPEDINMPIRMVPAIRFYSEPDSAGFADINTVRLVDIDVDGGLILGLGFSFDDVATVQDMLSGIQDYKDRGVLSHINKHFTKILDPNDPTNRHPSNN